MNSAATWFFIAGLTSTAPYASSRLGPMTEMECKQVAAVLPGQCRKIVALRTCGLDGRDGTYTACPILEGEIVEAGPRR